MRTVDLNVTAHSKNCEIADIFINNVYEGFAMWDEQNHHWDIFDSSGDWLSTGDQLNDLVREAF